MKKILFYGGIILIGLGSGIFLYRNKINIQNIKTEQEKINLFFEIYDNDLVTNSERKYSEEDEPDNYIAVIEIPKINLKKGLVDKHSYLNDVDKSIYTLPESIFPKDDEYSQIILASHSGNSYVSYFKDINKLEVNDEINLYYQGNSYIYHIIEKYEVEKNGMVPIKLYDKSNINLITCIEKTNRQLVVVGVLN